MHRNSENLPPTIGLSPEHIQQRPAVGANNSIQPADAAAIHTEEERAAMQNSPVQVMDTGALVGGGARAAYHASQQQRVVTCNLNNIALSE